jgi:tetratricopeptide (TPR) repeat protein
LTPKASDQSGFPFDTPSPGPGPRNAAAAAAGAAAGAAASGLAVPDGASPLPTSALNTPQRIAKVQNLYSQWADESDSDEDDDDEDGFMTPSEGLSEVEEEEDEEEEDPKASGAYRQVSGKFAAGNGSAAAGADSTAASSTLASELAVPTGPRLRRSKASAATVNKSVDIKFGDPLAVDQAEALPGDLELCRKAITLFLSSQMREAEELITQNDPNHNRMYMQSGHGLVESLKGMMTFDTDDLKWALELTKGTAETASKLRRPNDSVFSKIGGLVRSGAGLARLRAMSPLERHAELVFAETILIKAILAIVSGGDWLGLIKEAFNMRSAHGIYRQLQQFLDGADKDGFDESIDMDFRSGVLLGTGTSSLMLSLLPARVLKIAEVLGYTGDRTVALETLMSAGGWSAGKSVPAYTESNEGIRRPICDMILLTFHLVISVLMPVSGVDIPTARNILDYNMKRYPNGIFFLYFQARLYTSECEPEQANESLQKALELDLEYVQLQHMCLWDYGCNYLQLNNWEGARQCYEILRQESNWSRAVYTYATAVNIMELVNDPAHPEHTSKHVTELVTQIPKLVKKIAGKSLPIEKFIARKARKYTSQDNRLFLPAMELAYVFGSLGYTPRRILLSKWLPHIDAELAKLEASNPDEWGNGTEYWDDYALGHFLRGIVQAVARYQPPEASPNALQPIAGQPSDTELDAGAEADFKKVVECSPNVRLDHYVLYHNHYELGRLYAKRGDTVNAKANFEVVMNTKLPQPNLHAGGKTGKYSLEGALQIKTHAAMQDIKTGSVPASPALVAGKKSAPASIRSSKLKHQV